MFRRVDTVAKVVNDLRPRETHRGWDLGAFTYHYRDSMKRVPAILERLEALAPESAPALAQARAGVEDLLRTRPEHRGIYAAPEKVQLLDDSIRMAFATTRDLVVRDGDAALLAQLHKHAWPEKHGLMQGIDARPPSQVLREAELLLDAPDLGRGAGYSNPNVPHAARLAQKLDSTAFPEPVAPYYAIDATADDVRHVVTRLRTRLGDDAAAIDGAWSEVRALGGATPAVEAPARSSIAARLDAAATAVANRFPGLKVDRAAVAAATVLDEGDIVRMGHEARWIAGMVEESGDGELAARVARLVASIDEHQVARGTVQHWGGRVVSDVDSTLVGDASHLLRDPAEITRAHAVRDTELVGELAELRVTASSLGARMQRVLAAAGEVGEAPASTRGLAGFAATRVPIPSSADLGSIDDLAPRVALALRRSFSADPERVARDARMQQSASTHAMTSNVVDDLGRRAAHLEEAILTGRADLSTRLELLGDSAARGRLRDVDDLRPLADTLSAQVDELDAIDERLAWYRS